MAQRSGFTLVLGGGGWPAHAYFSGVFAAFADAGLDPRRAAHVVGTSAGSLHVALIGAGLSADELARAAERFSDSAAERPFTRSWHGGLDLLLRVIAALRVVLALVSRRKRLGRVNARTRWGLVQTRDPERYFGQLPLAWPETRLTFVSFDLVEGRRHGLTQNAHLGLELRDAVAASMALPAVMAPVMGGQHVLVDGGCSSGTNLDEARALETLVTVCVAPMSFDPDHPPAGLHRVLYTRANRTLDRQAARVREDGQDVVLIRPSGAALRLMAGNPLSPPDTARIAAEGRADAARCLADAQVRAWLAAAAG